MLEQRIQQQFFDSADLKYQSADVLVKPISEAVHAIVGCITAGGKVLACGHGASGSDARYFVDRFVGRFERERPGLAALSLTTDASIVMSTGDEHDFGRIFARQVEALGQPGDILLALTTNTNAADVLAAVDAALAKDMTIIALTGHQNGQGGSKMRARLTDTDVHIPVPNERSARIQEVHMLAIHCICDAVDVQLLGEQDHA